ncbi:cytochrome P450 [Streptomyces sp. IBSBF 2953]|nr:cytochrome P450 [Streptomyces hayashii]
MTNQQTVDALLDAYADQGRALRRVLWLAAHHPHQVAADPSLLLKALDTSPQAIRWCPPGCSGQCIPHPALMARHRTLNGGAGNPTSAGA